MSEIRDFVHFPLPRGLSARAEDLVKGPPPPREGAFGAPELCLGICSCLGLYEIHEGNPQATWLRTSKRRSPTGDLAKGIPRNTFALVPLLVITLKPSTSPFSVLAIAGDASPSEIANDAERKTRNAITKDIS